MQAGTDTALEDLQQLDPQPPDPPPARTPSVPPQDAPELAAAAASSASKGDLYIRYVDASGVPSERRISIHDVTAHGDDFALRAWCHERQDMRTFLISRVEEAVDPHTGEIIDDLYDWFQINAGNGDPDDELEADDALGAAVAVLVFIARADGRMVEAEREIIRNFIAMALSAMDLEILSHSELDKRLGHTSVDFPTFRLALEELAELPHRMRAGILGVAQAVVLADGKRHRFEMEALNTLREILQV
jgi:predicted DNA-binding transcriptional regulator YafY